MEAKIIIQSGGNGGIGSDKVNGEGSKKVTENIFEQTDILQDIYKLLFIGQLVHLAKIAAMLASIYGIFKLGEFFSTPLKKLNEFVNTVQNNLIPALTGQRWDETTGKFASPNPLSPIGGTAQLTPLSDASSNVRELDNNIKNLTQTQENYSDQQKNWIEIFKDQIFIEQNAIDIRQRGIETVMRENGLMDAGANVALAYARAWAEITKQQEKFWYYSERLKSINFATTNYASGTALWKTQQLAEAAGEGYYVDPSQPNIVRKARYDDPVKEAEYRKSLVSKMEANKNSLAQQTNR